MKRYEHKNYQYVSILAADIIDYIAIKRACGYKYDIEAQTLRRFDRYFANSGKFEITSEFVNTWSAAREGESYRTRLSRCNIAKGFLQYLNSIGKPAALPPSFGSSVRDKEFVPYIYTHDQIRILINSADEMPPPKFGSMLHIVFPAMLRILYGCGLRVSEVIALKKSDVNLNEGILFINSSKNGNSRQTPVSASLKTALNKYLIQMGERVKETSWFFPNAKGEPYTRNTISKTFRELLVKCGISRGNRGPRIHDLRHTHAVHVLNNWSRSGKDCYVPLPILAAYLGHKNVGCTEQYLRLTAEVFPDVLLQTQEISDMLIPPIEGVIS